jgi:hypothetical protein
MVKGLTRHDAGTSAPAEEIVAITKGDIIDPKPMIPEEKIVPLGKVTLGEHGYIRKCQAQGVMLPTPCSHLALPSP